MALTNALLKSMGIEGDQRDQIMAEHQATLQSIKDERDGLRDKAARVPELERQVQDLEKRVPTESWEEWKAKYESEHDAFEEYKVKADQERADAERASLYRALLLDNGIDPKRVDSVMRVTDLSGVVVKDGQIQDSEELGKRAAEEWKDFVVKGFVKGATVDTPPGGGGTGRTRDEILAIEDASERQAAIAENPELFGLE